MRRAVQGTHVLLLGVSSGYPHPARPFQQDSPPDLLD
jgi:hypothetical protein